MGIFGKTGWVFIGVVLLLAGILLRSGFIEWLLDVMGFLLIIAGIIVIVGGLIGLVTSKGGNS